MKARINKSGEVSFEGNEADINDLYTKLEAFESKVRQSFKATGVEGADEIFDSALNLGDILRALPKNQRAALQNDYENIIGLSRMLESASPQPYTSGTSGAQVAKFDINLNPDSTGKLNPLSIIYNRATVSTNYLGQQSIGTNILTTKHLKSLAEPPQEIIAGHKYLIFDTETAGLGTGSIREIASRRVTADADGNFVINNTSDDTFHRNLKTTQMRIGSVYNQNQRKAMSLEESLQSRGYSFIEGAPQDGNEFAKVIDDFLNEISKADHIVGQNLQFDVTQIFEGVKGTNLYKNDAKFRAKVKKVQSELNRPGKIIDTLELARQRLKLDLAPELSLKGSMSTHSLDNIILQTNLLDLMKTDLGGANFNKLFQGSGVHGASTDVMLETHLFKYLMDPNSGLVPERQTFKDMPEVKAAIRSSYAMTPVSNIQDLGHISPEVLDRMATIRGDQPHGVPAAIRVVREDRVVAIGDLSEFKDPNTDQMLQGDALRKALENENQVFYRMTPVQQQMLVQRNMAMLGSAASSREGPRAIRGSASFSSFAVTGNNSFMNPDGTLRIGSELPSMEAYEQFQRRAYEAGDILAGLSLPERMVTEGMSRASRLDDDILARIGSIESTGSSLLDNLGISYFKSTENMYFSEKTGAVSLPPSLLKHLEDEKVLNNTKFASKAQGIRVSVFQVSDTGDYRAQAAVDLSDNDMKALANYFENLTDQDIRDMPSEVRKFFNLQSSTPKRIAGALRDIVNNSDMPTSVSLGYLDGKGAEAAYNVMAPFMNSQQIMSDMTEMTFTSTMIDSDDSIVRLSAFTGRDYMDAGEKSLIDDIARQTANQRATVVEGIQAGEYRAQVNADRVIGSLGRARGAISESQTMRAIQAAEITSNITKKLPIAGAILAGAFAGKKVFDSFQQRQQVNETFDFQGYETGTDYYNLEQQVQAATIRRQRRLDPLATAGLTANMRNARNNHMLMGPNSSAHLFNGVII